MDAAKRRRIAEGIRRSIEENTRGGDWMLGAEDKLVDYLKSRRSAAGDSAREYWTAKVEAIYAYVLGRTGRTYWRRTLDDDGCRLPQELPRDHPSRHWHLPWTPAAVPAPKDKPIRIAGTCPHCGQRLPVPRRGPLPKLCRACTRRAQNARAKARRDADPQRSVQAAQLATARNRASRLRRRITALTDQLAAAEAEIERLKHSSP